jgi:hypothetical protein
MSPRTSGVQSGSSPQGLAETARRVLRGWTRGRAPEETPHRVRRGWTLGRAPEPTASAAPARPARPAAPCARRFHRSTSARCRSAKAAAPFFRRGLGSCPNVQVGDGPRVATPKNATKR